MVVLMVLTINSNMKQQPKKIELNKLRQGLIQITNNTTSQMERIESEMRTFDPKTLREIIGMGIRLASNLNLTTGEPNDLEILSVGLYSSACNQYRWRVLEALSHI
jgi:hypothetical protein